MADRKNYSLISAPVYLCTLKDKEEVRIISYSIDQSAMDPEIFRLK